MPNLDLEFLANLAQIVSVPIAIISVLLAIWIYFKSKKRRAISCEMDSISSLVEIKAGEALEGDIEIRYKGKPVENLFSVRAKVRNTGNLAIRKSDILKSITFTFDPNAELLRQPEIVQKKPENLKTSWTFGATETMARPNIACVDFELLNPGDEFTIEFTCTGKSSIPKVEARIEGINQIALLEPAHIERRLAKAFVYVVTGFPIVMITLVLILQPPHSLVGLLVMWAIVGAMVLCVAPTWWWLIRKWD